jgi:hypothetical protein
MASGILGSLTSKLGLPATQTPGAAGPKGGMTSWTIHPWQWHILLTGIAPFMLIIPFLPTSIQSILVCIFVIPHTWGVNGVNLVASNSSFWALGKAAFNMLCIGLYDIMAIYFAGQWWLPALKALLRYANPWYVFDMIQVFHPKFKDIGYKIPFLNKRANTNKEKGAKLVTGDIGYIQRGSSGADTITYGSFYKAAGAAAVFLFPALYTLFDNLPPELKGKVQPLLDSVVSVGSIITAVAGGGIGTFVLLPQLATGLQGNFAKLMAGGSEEGEATAETTVVANTANNAQLGGGDVPSVEELANSLLKNKSTAQGGGGGSIDTESATFMGLLGITILGGISVAVLRRKRLSAATL